jgi:hypothetical protein
MVFRVSSWTALSAVCLMLHGACASWVHATGLAHDTTRQSLAISSTAALKPVDLAGKIDGLFVQCREEGPFVRATKNGKAISIEAYQALEMKKIAKKLKGSAKIKAEQKLAKRIAALSKKAVTACSKVVKLCLNPNTRIFEKDGTTTCEAGVSRCVLSTMRCTNSVPGSCACDAKAPADPATKNPPPQTTPLPGVNTPPPLPPSTTPAPWEGEVSVQWESMGMAGGYRVFMLGAKDMEPFPEFSEYSTFATSIAKNGTIAGGLVQSKGVLYPEEPVTADSPVALDDDRLEYLSIAPIIATKSKTTVMCELTQCPKGLVISDVNNFGKATANMDGGTAGPPVPYQLDVATREMLPLMANNSSYIKATRISDSGVVLGIISSSGALGDEEYLFNSPIGSRIDQLKVGLQLMQVNRQQIQKELLEAIIRSYEKGDQELCPPELYRQTKLDADFTLEESFAAIQTLGARDLIAGEVKVYGLWGFTNPCDPRGARQFDGRAHFSGPLAGPYTFTKMLDPYDPNRFDVAHINDSAKVIGSSTDSHSRPSLGEVDGTTKGAAWGIIDTSQLKARDLEPRAVNNSGSVVGFMEMDGSGSSYLVGFLVQNGKAIDLNKLIFPNSPWTLQSANGINDCGEIVGVATRKGQGEIPDLARAVLLSPPGCR